MLDWGGELCHYLYLYHAVKYGSFVRETSQAKRELDAITVTVFRVRVCGCPPSPPVPDVFVCRGTTNPVTFVCRVTSLWFPGLII